MKIGIDISALTSKVTGTSRYISSLLEQASESEHEILTFQPGSSGSEYYSSNKRKLLPAPHRGLLKHLYRNFYLNKEMLNAGIGCGIFPDYFMARGFTRPAAVVIHDLSFITHPGFYSRSFIRFYRNQLNNTLRLNPVIVTISEYSRNQINRLLSITKEKIFLLQGYSSRLKNNDIKNDSGGRPYFLYVGHVEPRKNLNFLIENFVLWNKERNNGFRLKIAGELWIKSPEINSMISMYKNHPDVEFTGYVNEEALHKLYLHASAFVHISFVEGFGMPVLEAMHYGLPVLCTADSATEEISRPYSVTADPFKSSSLMKGFDLIHELMLKGRRFNYNIKYSPERMQRQLDDLLEVLGRKVKGPLFPVIKRSHGVEEALEKTLLYAKLFNTGIKKENLHSCLFDIQLSKARLEEALESLHYDKKVISEKGILYLNKPVQSRYSGNTSETGVKKTPINLLRLLKRVPFISMISFSGGTAHYGFENHDDLDLFIITKTDTVYIAYFFIHILSLIFRARKELCANYLIDESDLEIRDQKDFYTAHQIITLIPYKNQGLLNLFWNKNDWVKDFFPNFPMPLTAGYKKTKFFRFLSPLNKLLKNFYRRLYKDYLLNNSGSLKLTENCIKLHTNDYRIKTAEEFSRAWHEYTSGNGFREASTEEKYLLRFSEPAAKEVNG